MGLSTTYTKTETDFLIQQLEKKTASGYKGDLNKTDVAPTQIGFYGLLETGIYTNLGGINAPIGKLNFASFDGTTWSLVSVDLPSVQLSNNINGTSTTIAATEKSVGDLNSKLENELFNKSSISNFSATVGSNGNAANLSAINNIGADRNGVIKEISGRFPSSGNLKLFIASNRIGAVSPYTFTIKKIFDVSIPNSGLNIIDISSQKIEILSGERIGIETSSTTKPFYGTDNSLGFGWYQNALTLVEGNNYAFTEVANASFALGFSVQENKFVNKTDVYLKSETNILIENKAEKSDVYNNYKLYELPIITGSAAAALLGNNVAVTKTGYISKMKIRAASSGIMTFQFFERLTNNATTGGKTDTFKAKKSFSINVNSGFYEYSLPEKILANKGDYLTIVSGGSTLSPVLNNTGGIAHLGWWQGSPGVKTEGSNLSLTYQNGTVIFEYWIDEIIYQGIQPLIKINKITAVKNPENYNSIRNLISSITDATEINQYEIFVPEGTWNEYDWQGKKYVKIVGSLNGKSIINIDPLGSMASFLAPSNLHFATEAGKTLNNVSQYARHIIFVKDDIWCENLTFNAKDSKYVVHIDNTGYKKVYFKNCRFIEDTCNFAIGMGINGGQEVFFDGCIIKSLNNGKYGFFYHNWNNQNSSNTVTFNRCKFDNCSYGYIDELGSNQADFINVYNCFTTLGTPGEKFNFMVDITSDSKTYWINPISSAREPNPKNVPYCIVLNAAGTKVSQLLVSDSGKFNSSWVGVPQRDVNIIKNMSIIEI